VNPALLDIREIGRDFLLSDGLFRPKRRLRAVDAVTLSLRRGEVLGIVGESGCGKSTLAKMLIGLLARPRARSGSTASPITAMNRRALARRVQPVFQDPYSSLNPRKTIGSILNLPLATHGIGDAGDRPRRVAAIMDRVGLSKRLVHSYPNQLSAGSANGWRSRGRCSSSPRFLSATSRHRRSTCRCNRRS
jgi:peptide/nickel transport system ATP-binding protein